MRHVLRRFGGVLLVLCSDLDVALDGAWACLLPILLYAHIVLQCNASCQVFFSGKMPHTRIQCKTMRKDSALSFRIPAKLKAELERVAMKEGRSLSQVCEALLNGGMSGYRKGGAKYLQRYLSRQKAVSPSDRNG